MGWVKKIDVKNEIINEVSQLAHLLLPNFIPCTIMKNKDTPANTKDKMYAIILNHQGSLKSDMTCLNAFLL